uniref:Uncharacterized protein n=1 Tax=mine drainage metagenome TaxID=410659 RepID=E6PTU3_9ZZZZ
MTRHPAAPSKASIRGPLKIAVDRAGENRFKRLAVLAIHGNMIAPMMASSINFAIGFYGRNDRELQSPQSWEVFSQSNCGDGTQHSAAATSHCKFRRWPFCTVCERVWTK